jgi:hypothetical protein
MYYRFPIEFVAGGFAILALIGIAFLGALLAGGGPPLAWALAVGMVGFASFVVYWLSQSVYELIVQNGTISWRSLRAHGSCPISDLGKVRPTWNGAAARVDTRSTRTLSVVVVSPRLPSFMRSLADAYPQLDLWTSGYVGLRWPSGRR